MTRVAFTIGSLGIGGAERHVVELANHLARRGFAAHVICFRSGGPFEGQLDRRVETLVLNKRAGNDPLLVARLARVLRSRGVQILHSLNWGTYLESVLAAKVSGVPVRIHAQRGMERGNFEGISNFRRRARYLSMRFGANAVARIITVSQEIRRWVVEEWKAPPEKVLLIPNGVPLPTWTARPEERARLRRELGLGEESLLVLAVGRLSPVKNYPLLLRAAAELARMAPLARVLIARDGPERPALEEMRRELRLEERVFFLGWRRDVRELLSMVDLYVLSSRSEGSPQALLEAMAAGLPTVATAVGGCEEIVVHGRTGLLVPPDDAHGLALALASLLDDRRGRRAMGEESRSRVRSRYSSSAMLDTYESLYQGLLGGNGGG